VPLDKTDDAWRFLRRQQLVRDEPGDKAAFGDIVRWPKLARMMNLPVNA
jgi:hypothetical protein